MTAALQAVRRAVSPDQFAVVRANRVFLDQRGPQHRHCLPSYANSVAVDADTQFAAARRHLACGKLHLAEARLQYGPVRSGSSRSRGLRRRPRRERRSATRSRTRDYRTGWLR